MKSSFPRLWPVFLMVGSSACREFEVPPLDEPFVSEQLLGSWAGDWSVSLPNQSGRAEIEVEQLGEGEVQWIFYLEGGALSGDDEPPLEVILTGQDDTDVVEVEGVADKLGLVQLAVDSDGLISGNVYPPSLPDLEVWGYVRPEEIHLEFFIMAIFPGYAIVMPVETDSVAPTLPGEIWEHP